MCCHQLLLPFVQELIQQNPRIQMQNRWMVSVVGQVPLEGGCTIKGLLVNLGAWLYARALIIGRSRCWRVRGLGSHWVQAFSSSCTGVTWLICHWSTLQPCRVSGLAGWPLGYLNHFSMKTGTPGGEIDVRGSCMCILQVSLQPNDSSWNGQIVHFPLCLEVLKDLVLLDCFQTNLEDWGPTLHHLGKGDSMFYHWIFAFASCILLLPCGPLPRRRSHERGDCRMSGLPSPSEKVNNF